MENPNKNLFDCQRMFRHACAFSDCADFALKEFRPDIVDVAWYTTPAIVNSAFACEVFLKTLILFHGITAKKQHGIKELYELLPADTKESLKEATIADYGGGWIDSFGRTRLEGISDAFVQWRYSYEQMGSLNVDMGFLAAFRNSLREACCRKLFHMTWKEYRQ